MTLKLRNKKEDQLEAALLELAAADPPPDAAALELAAVAPPPPAALPPAALELELAAALSYLRIYVAISKRSGCCSLLGD
jgi:hypothetical protein